MHGLAIRFATKARRCRLVAVVAWVALSIGACVAGPAGAADVVKPPRPPDFARFAFHYELLDEAMQRTVAPFGPYVEQPYTEALTTNRIIREAIKGDLINVLAIDFGNEALTEGMTPVPFPIDKGLLGYRVCLIAKGNQARIGKPDTLEKLRVLSVGRGAGWGDIRIFEHNRIPIETSPDYLNLFAMLARGRFDLFPRGITEIVAELASLRDRYPDLAIEEHVVIKYAYAQFFYVSKTAPRIADRVRHGLETMHRDGSFDRLFDRHFAEALATLRLDKRSVVQLENPFVPDWVPLERKDLWLDPTKK